MKQTSTIYRVAFKNYPGLIVSVLNILLSHFMLGLTKTNGYPKLFTNGIKSFLVCISCWLMPSNAKADTPIPTSVVSNYDPITHRLTLTVQWTWGSSANNKYVTAAVFADLNGDGISPTHLDNPATYTSGGNAFPAGLSARDEFLGQLAISTIEGTASSAMYPAGDHTDNGIAAQNGFGPADPRVLFPYGTTGVGSVGTSGTFTLTYDNVFVTPTRICVVMYDVHTGNLNDLSGGHSPRSANPGVNGDNSVDDGNGQGTVACGSLVVLRCAIDKTEVACQTQAAINASYAMWLASVTASGCNGVLTNNSTGAPSASGGSKTVTFTYTQSGCSNQAAVTTCTATFTVPVCGNGTLTLGNRVWYDTNNNGINDASENGIRNVIVKLYTDADNNNVADGASIASTTTDMNGNYSFTGLSAGNYIVGVVRPNGYISSSVNAGDPDNNTDNDDNGQVVNGTEVRGLAITLASGTEPTGGNTNNTYDFGLLPDCNCTNSPSNLLINGSFENGTTGWNWSAANGSLTTGTGYVACGTKNGFNNQSSGTSKVWQDVAVTEGVLVSFSGFAGTHTPGIACSPKLSLIFLNSANTIISQTDVNVTRNVDVNYGQLEQYSIRVFSPSGTVKVRVQSSITCNTMKLDAFCLTAPSGGPLPITLLDLTATKNGCTANLSWKTSSEVNADRFEVEVSTNNSAVYATAGSITAAGNSSTTRYYQYSYVMQPGVNYLFRLKMIDKDGSFKYSDVRPLNCTTVKDIVIAPNPVVTQFVITGMEKGKNNVAVYDASGQWMKTQLITQSQGAVNIFNLEPGFYTVKITSETGNTVIKKIIKY